LPGGKSADGVIGMIGNRARLNFVSSSYYNKRGSQMADQFNKQEKSDAILNDNLETPFTYQLKPIP